MTRETKLGIAVSCAFLVLVGVVVVHRMSDRPPARVPTGPPAANPPSNPSPGSVLPGLGSGLTPAPAPSALVPSGPSNPVQVESVPPATPTPTGFNGLGPAATEPTPLNGVQGTQ